MKIYIKTLGCDKNTCDSRAAAGLLLAEGHELCEDPSKSDVLIVNTCGFIKDAKQQSIDAIISLGAAKKKGQRLIVTGCLSQRYARELADAMPEIDAMLGVNDYGSLAGIVAKGGERAVLCGKAPSRYCELGTGYIGEGTVTAPLKIAEGCRNVCSFCAIPFIRGGYRSRSVDAILSEARMLAANGVKELLIVAQDTTAYGSDLADGTTLASLLRQLCRVDGIKWIRLMYCYEEEITQELIDVIKSEPKICRYLDIPVQHGSEKILKSMNRRSTPDSIRLTINNLREQIPGIAIRTSIIVGYPGETKADFKELLEFVSEMSFDRLGAFTYSKEEGTKAARLPHQVKEDAKERRWEKLMELQRRISLVRNASHIGKVFEVLVEEKLEDGTYTGRTEMDAPDIDNGVLFTSDKELSPGGFAKVRIEDAFDYDLSGRAVQEN